MKNRLLLGAVLVTFFLFAFSGSIMAQNDMVSICHASGQAGTVKYETLLINQNGLNGHFGNNGTTKAGHESDYMGACATPTPTPTANPTATPNPTSAPQTCDLSKLDRIPHPDPRDWNFTGEFKVTNTASYPMTFDWLLDMWGSSNQDQTGTTTLQPGGSIVLGMGKICSKWQLDITCGGVEWGAIVESHVNACVTPTPTPTATPTPSPTATPVPTPTPTATPTPTPVSSVGKQSKLAVTTPVCGQTNMDVIAELFNDGKPVEGITVKFVYNNEAKFAKTDVNGKASVLYGYRNDTNVEMDPEEDGYPSQLHKVSANLNCPFTSTSAVLGASTDSRNGQIAGMADAGVAEDIFMGFVGFMGTLSTAVGAIKLTSKKQ